MKPNFIPYGLDELESDIEKLMDQYGSIIEMEMIGFSVHNRPLYSFRLGKGNRTLHISGSHHAREWITSWLCMELLQTYAEHYEAKTQFTQINVRQLLDEIALVFVPMVDPDGVVLATKGWEEAGLSYEVYRTMAERSDIGDAYWLWKANIVGVDLNRQYDMNWDLIRHSPAGPAAMNFKGDSPASEPEVQALIHSIHDLNPEAVIAYHTAGEEIFWYHGQDDEEYKRDLDIAERLASLTGYELIPEDEYVAGGFADWFVDVYKKPGFTVELGTQPHPVNMSFSKRIWEQNKILPLVLIEELLKL